MFVAVRQNVGLKYNYVGFADRKSVINIKEVLTVVHGKKSLM